MALCNVQFALIQSRLCVQLKRRHHHLPICNRLWHTDPTSGIMSLGAINHTTRLSLMSLQRTLNSSIYAQNIVQPVLQPVLQQEYVPTSCSYFSTCCTRYSITSCWIVCAIGVRDSGLEWEIGVSILMDCVNSSVGQYITG